MQDNWQISNHNLNNLSIDVKGHTNQAYTISDESISLHHSYPNSPSAADTHNLRYPSYSLPKSSPRKLEETKRAQMKFQNTMKSAQLKTTAIKNKCTCDIDRQYDCFKCTRYYPIQVRRSLDGESGRIYGNCSRKNANSNSNTFNQNIEKVNELPVIIDPESLENPLICHDKLNNIKPSRQPSSSTIDSLIKINNSNNSFIPPPNINLTEVMEKILEL